jgi:hypothetical protein
MTRTTSTFLSLLAILVFAPTAVNAIPVTITYTTDNRLDPPYWGLCDDSSCQTGDIFPTGANAGDWRFADSYTVDLGVGTHYFAWFGLNVGTGSSTNPAGLLAEITWSGGSNSSGSAWDIATSFDDVFDGTAVWESATQYGANGGANIWTSVMGGPIAGISGDAQWIWSANNFSADMDQEVVFRTSITIAEPGTLALLGIGLVGLGLAKKV